jgi:cadmium resistance protein CadD (predicted permease)
MVTDTAVLRVMFGLFVFALLVAIIVFSIGLRKPQPDTPIDYERRRLYFAAVVLIGLGMTFFLAMSMYFFSGPDVARVEAAKKIFETCVAVIPPIVTLVLGYYFGRSESQRATGRAQAAAAAGNPVPQPQP